jgi:hypothetical protein
MRKKTQAVEFIGRHCLLVPPAICLYLSFSPRSSLPPLYLSVALTKPYFGGGGGGDEREVLVYIKGRCWRYLQDMPQIDFVEKE